MAVRFDASGDMLRRTANVVARAGPWTWCAWVYLVATGASGSYHTVFTPNNNTADNYDSLVLHYNGSNTRVMLIVDNGSYNETRSSVTNLSTATWYHLACVRSSSTSITTYLNGASEHTGSSASQTGSWSRMDEGAHSYYGGDYFNGRVTATKIWDVALTASQLLQEMYSLRPQRFDSLNLWTPHFDGSGERARDYGGNARNWTEVGTLSDESLPPVSW